MLHQRDGEVEHEGQDRVHEDDDADDLHVIADSPLVGRLFRGLHFVTLRLLLLLGQLLDIGAQLLGHGLHNYG